MGEKCVMIRIDELVGIVVAALLLLIGPTRRSTAVAGEAIPMNEINKDFGKLNPNAPSALSRFAFLIGRWRCEAKVKLANGVSQTFPATWVGRYILDGYAIADEYRMTGSSGELIVLGLNFRVYDATKQIWKIKWLNALDGTWWDLGPEELSGVRFDGQSVTYSFREPAGACAYQRVTYTSVSPTHFTWRGEKSDDGNTWSEFMVIEDHRSKE